MELWGSTNKYTYTDTNRCSLDPMQSRDDTYAFPLPTSQCTSHKLPWRQSRYFSPVGDKREASTPAKVPCGAGELQSRKTTQPCTCDCPLKNSDSPIHPCIANRGVYFPFRKVIHGSKLVMLPEKDCHHCHAQQNHARRIPASRSDTECSQQQKIFNPSPPRGKAGTCRDPNLPTTPPLGRSAWLNEFIQSRLKSGNMKGTDSQPGCPFYPFWKERDHATHKQIEERIKAVSENTNHYNTPMDHFKNDQRFLMNSLRNYKRDAELQKQKCEFADPKIFADVGGMDWYNFMMSKQECQSPLDERTESALLRSDFVRVQDALGGSCYLDPKNRAGGDDVTRLVCPDKLSSHIQPGLRPTVVSSNKRPPRAKSALECAIEDNLRELDTEVNERDKLLAILVETEHSLHDVKDRYYRLGFNERYRTDLVGEMHRLEGCQIKILNEIRCKERKMDSMMRYQHRLESQLTQYHLGFTR
ncbi:hypothetical protein BsWGS_15231 [Bradybaena similaris]